MREKIEKRREAIRRRVAERGQTDGTEIATAKEMQWLVEQAARDGIMLYVAAQPETYKNGNECYCYYTAMSALRIDDKERVRRFADTFSLLTVGELNRLLRDTDTTDPDGQRQAENIKQIRRLIQARDRRRRRRQEAERLEAEREMAELEEKIRIEAERKEAADRCNDLSWLVARIEALGWEVTLRRKSDEGAEGSGTFAPCNQTNL